MSGSLPPGIGERNKMERRIASLERFIGQFRVSRIFARSQFGKTRQYEILAREGRFKKFSELAAGPFLLSVAPVEESYEWQVAIYGSSVLDGTNGENLVPETLGLFGVPQRISATKNIVLSAAIDKDLAASDWKLETMDDPDEIIMDETSGRQTKLRLLIGTIHFDDEVASAKQLIFTGQRLTYGFLNGKLVRVFESAPSHPDSIDV
jgi:hypothetical protein